MDNLSGGKLSFFLLIRMNLQGDSGSDCCMNWHRVRKWLVWGWLILFWLFIMNFKVIQTMKCIRKFSLRLCVHGACVCVHVVGTCERANELHLKLVPTSWGRSNRYAASFLSEHKFKQWTGETGALINNRYPYVITIVRAYLGSVLNLSLILWTVLATERTSWWRGKKTAALKVCLPIC